MAKVQTRRSISVSGRTYDKLQEYCRLRGETCSGVVEDLLVQLLDQNKPLSPKVTETVGRLPAPTPNVQTIPKNKVLGSRPLQPGQKSPSPPVEMDEETKASRRVSDRIFTF